MGYLKGHLIEGERVVFMARPHRVVLLKPALWTALAVALFAAAAWHEATRGLSPAALLVAAAALPGWLRWRMTQYIVTNKRLCVRTGIVRVETMETVLSKVGTIGVEQGPGGRLLDYGTVVVKGLGGGAEALPLIEKPHLLRRKVHEALALG